MNENSDIDRLRVELNHYRNKLALSGQLSKSDVEDLFYRLLEAYRAIEEHRAVIQEFEEDVQIAMKVFNGC